jgi:Ca2+:H+ antiporter
VIVALQALMKDELRVVQASMIGSIFSNLLLVLGCCFFFGGLTRKEQSFNVTTATASMGLLALSSVAMILPTPFAEYYQVKDEDVLLISRSAAIGLIFMYLQLLAFQLWTHREVFDGSSGGDDGDDDDEEEEEPAIPMWMALFGLAVVTGLVTIFSDYLVGSIDEFCDESGISRTFVGLIILPIVGNAVEHITAVNVAMKNKMVGFCFQTRTACLMFCSGFFEFDHFSYAFAFFWFLSLGSGFVIGCSGWVLYPNCIVCRPYHRVGGLGH